ncbi:hypothetical protein BY996DRAFT_6517014 [Phakopsora pachyrhizi]|nr:hypothetical protein BY996DRAFT_6517014 [Phakopsora pachyrhizi]
MDHKIGHPNIAGYMAVWINLEHNFLQVSPVDIRRIGIKVLDALRRRCNRRLLFEEIGCHVPSFCKPDIAGYMAVWINLQHYFTQVSLLDAGRIGIKFLDALQRRSAFWTPEEYGLKSLMLRKGGEADLDAGPD